MILPRLRILRPVYPLNHRQPRVKDKNEENMAEK
jgi:hypothetical protein